MSKHTAGPWESVDLGTSIIDLIGGRFVIKAQEAPGGIGHTIGGLGLEEEANARLIAAAPEMAEILKRILANPAWLAISDVYDGLALLKKAGVI